MNSEESSLNETIFHQHHQDVTTNGTNGTETQSDSTTNSYAIEGKRLREDIVSRVSALQTILNNVAQVSKERRDFITRTIVEQTNYRLEKAKQKAEKILSEVSGMIIITGKRG